MTFKSPSRPNACRFTLMDVQRSSLLQIPAIRTIYLRCLRRRCVFARYRTVQIPYCRNGRRRRFNSQNIMLKYNAGSTRECGLPVWAPSA